jgi:MFS family permease
MELSAARSADGQPDSTNSSAQSTSTRRRPGAALAVLCGTQLLLLVDFSIVNIALPRIQEDLRFSAAGLSWVVSAYALAFGGLLLLGGRLSDLLGRRRLFVAGLVIFGAASLIGGLAGGPEVLVLMRGVQGAGAAVLAPALLSLLTTMFPEGRERDRAIGWLTAASASGFGLGVLAGGVLTEAFGWRAVFLMNVPLIAVAIPLSYALLAYRGRPAPGRPDIAGAVLGVAGLTTVSYGLTVASQPGHGVRGLALVGAGLVLIGALILVERRARNPLLPLRLFRLPNLSAAFGVGALAAGVLGTGTLLLSLYLQQVRHLGALAAGLMFLPFGVVIAFAARNAPRVAGRLGLRWALVVAILFMASGTAALGAMSAAGAPLAAVVSGMLLLAAGGGTFFTLFTIAGTSGVGPESQGVAAGLINTSTQVGTAFATAVLVTLAGVHGAAAGGGHTAGGFAFAFAFATAILAGAAALAATTVR